MFLSLASNSWLKWRKVRWLDLRIGQSWAFSVTIYGPVLIAFFQRFPFLSNSMTVQHQTQCHINNHYYLIFHAADLIPRFNDHWLQLNHHNIQLKHGNDWSTWRMDSHQHLYNSSLTSIFSVWRICNTITSQLSVKSSTWRLIELLIFGIDLETRLIIRVHSAQGLMYDTSDLFIPLLSHSSETSGGSLTFF